jgi:2-dehydropantoate 2-reductase
MTMSTKPRVLLVGAGAIGQVYGRFLQAGGCELSFLVKEKYAEEARRGFTLYEPGLFDRSPAPRLFSGFGVHVSIEEVASQRWDQVWLCVSSTAMRAGGWVDELARATGEATWVTLQPAIDDRDWLLRRIPPERLVSGVVPFLSFHAPLKPGDPFPSPGTAVWFPPLAAGLFSGPQDRLDGVLRVLRAGRYPARRVRDAVRATAPASAVLTAFVVGLELAGWSFQRFLEPESLERTLGVAREAVRIAARRTQQSPSAILRLLRPTLFKLLLPTASRMVPFDLETYLRVHFTKVSDQTRLMVGEYIELGNKAGLPVEALRASAR